MKPRVRRVVKKGPAKRRVPRKAKPKAGAAKAPRVKGLKNLTHMLSMFVGSKGLHAAYKDPKKGWVIRPRAKGIVLAPVKFLAERRTMLDQMIKEGQQLQVPKNAERAILNALRGRSLSKTEAGTASAAQGRLKVVETRDIYFDKRIPQVFGEGKRAKAALVELYKDARQQLRGLHGKINQVEYNFRLELLRQAASKLRKVNF